MTTARSLSLKLSDTRVYEPQIQARLGTTAHFCKVVDDCADMMAAQGNVNYTGTSLIKNSPPPLGPP